jgi:hypothetical protein
MAFPDLERNGAFSKASYKKHPGIFLSFRNQLQTDYIEHRFVLNPKKSKRKDIFNYSSGALERLQSPGG